MDMVVWMPKIAHDKRLFDLLIEIIIDRGKTAEYGINSDYNGISRFRQPFYQTAEKALSSSLP